MEKINNKREKSNLPRGNFFFFFFLFCSKTIGRSLPFDIVLRFNFVRTQNPVDFFDSEKATYSNFAVIVSFAKARLFLHIRLDIPGTGRQEGKLERGRGGKK